ncbi:MAG: 2Fe-2S iron-sulfur cluster-binding protein [Dehalococcoidia bacterium]|nr:2Fe-2S iron-sulfur cluster-binding protein [Dehalococcoidia bacterium]
MNVTDKAIVKILRFDPKVGEEPRYQTYEIPPEGWKNRRVIDTIRYIYKNFDHSLAFRDWCHAGLCGGCAMVVNGEPILVCQQIAEREMTIEPHPKFEIIKDLVVDFEMMKGANR